MGPGFYANMSARLYLSDMTRDLESLPDGVTAPDIPSLNSTLVKVMIDACPAKVAHQHPRLNPPWPGTKASKAMTLGSVAHSLLLGRGKEFTVIPFSARNAKGAKAVIEEIEVQNKRTRQEKLIILTHEHQAACAMVTAAHKALLEIDKHAFDSEYGYGEMCIYARDPSGAWTRALVDWYGDRHPAGVQCWDYKTIEGSANPDSLHWHVNRQGWAIQAAFQERILAVLKPDLRGKVRFRFLVQEQETPHLCAVVEPDAGAMLLAHKACAVAIGMWQRCLATNTWPGYPSGVRLVPAISSMEGSWLEREMGNPLYQELLAADVFLNVPTTPGGTLPPDGPAEAAETPKPRRGRRRLTDEERAQRAAQRAGEASERQMRKVEL